MYEGPFYIRGGDKGDGRLPFSFELDARSVGVYFFSFYSLYILFRIGVSESVLFQLQFGLNVVLISNT